ncbi:MAG: hypothetical protein SVO01_00775 [Thermotogota bacterium]|nr:hypothetical protein [Thermotogota bacterium]
MCYDNCPYFKPWSECCTRPFDKPCIAELQDREEDESEEEE